MIEVGQRVEGDRGRHQLARKAGWCDLDIFTRWGGSIGSTGKKVGVITRGIAFRFSWQERWVGFILKRSRQLAKRAGWCHYLGDSASSAGKSIIRGPELSAGPKERGGDLIRA